MINNKNLKKNKITQNDISKTKEFETPFKYLKINFNNKEHISILNRFYNELYILEFTNENEAESLENIIKQSKRMFNIKECNYHCIIVLQENEIIGGIIGDYLCECNCGVIEFIVVNPKKRRLHIASNLISIIFNYFNEYTKLYYNDNEKCIDYCFFECENPNKVDLKNKNDCINRLHFWNKKKAYRLNFNYYQTSLEEYKKSVDSEYLCVIIVNESLMMSKSIKKSKIIKFIECYFKYCFNKDINENLELIQMKNDLKNINEIQLCNLV